MPTRADREATRSSNAVAERISLMDGEASNASRHPCLRYTTPHMSFGESLRTLAGDSHALVGFLIAAGLVLVLTPLVGRLAPMIGGLDDKTDRPRVHKGAIPRVGGLAIVAGILIPTAILMDLDGPYLGIFIGTLLVAALGLYDDLRHVSPKHKMVGVMLIALIPVVGFGVTFDRLTIPLVSDFDIGWLAFPLSVLWIALLANLV